jgi:hypothetical protein
VVPAEALPPAPLGESVDPAHAPSATMADSNSALNNEQFMRGASGSSTVVPNSVRGNIPLARSKKKRGHAKKTIRVPLRKKMSCFW